MVNWTSIFRKTIGCPEGYWARLQELLVGGRPTGSREVDYFGRWAEYDAKVAALEKLIGESRPPE